MISVETSGAFSKSFPFWTAPRHVADSEALLLVPLSPFRSGLLWGAVLFPPPLNGGSTNDVLDVLYKLWSQCFLSNLIALNIAPTQIMSNSWQRHND